MTLMSHIRQLSSELVLDLLQDKKILSGFKDNQLIEAKVTQVLPQGRAQLLIEGKRVDVKSHVPLSENDILFLKVVKSGESQTLKLVESYKPVTQAPGLSEMRALGAEGPHGILARLINTASGSRPPALGPPPTPDPNGQGGASLNETDRSPGDRTKPPSAQVQARPVHASSSPVLETLIKAETIPLPLKLSFLISAAPKLAPEIGIPDTVIDELNTQLESLLKEQAALPVSRPSRSDAPPTPMQLLEQRSQALIKTLTPGDRSLLTQVLRDPTRGLSEKIQRLVSSQTEMIALGKGFSKIKDSLLRALTPRTFLPDAPAAPPTAPGVSEAVNAPMTEASSLINKNLFTQLRHLIHTMSLNTDEPFDPATMQRLVKNSGLMWENKVRVFSEALRNSQANTPVDIHKALPSAADDVKALSMKLAESMESGGRETMENLKHFVDRLDKLQLLNSHSAEEAGRFLLPLPFYSGDTLKFGQLFVDLDKKQGQEKKEGDRMVRVAFLLDMSQLGHLQADFAIFRKSLSGEFIVENARVQQDIDQALPEFKADLARKGYTATRMECRIVEPGVLSGSSLAERMVDPGDGSVSILI